MVPDCENASFNPEGEWPSDDSQDDDYDPERNLKSFSCSRTNTEENVSDDASSSASLFLTSEEFSLQSGRLGNGGIMKGESCLCRNRWTDSDNIQLAGLIDSIDSDDATGRITNSRRPRRDVDYKKLHDVSINKTLKSSSIIP